MLILTCRAGDTIEFSGGIRIKIIHCETRQSRIGIEAPKDVQVTKRTLIRKLKDAVAGVANNAKALALIFAFTLLAGLAAPSHASDPGCTKASGIFTSFDEAGFYPMRIAGSPTGVGFMPDDIAAPVCYCPGRFFGMTTEGEVYGIWLPDRIIETVRKSYCSPALGGMIGGGSSTTTGFGGGASKTDGIAQDSFLNMHMIPYPAQSIAGSMLSSCTKSSNTSFPVYLTELDPTWNDEALMNLTTPQSSLFSGTDTILACAQDAAASVVGQPLLALFWCAGTWGTVYPTAGFIGNTGDTQTVHALQVVKSLAMLQNRLMIPRMYGDAAVCMNTPWPVLLKQQYKFQELSPVHNPTEHWMGEPALMWGDTLPPANSNDFDTLVWDYFECCDNP
ncbi:MAG: TraU family protein [Rhodanobacter sp.]